MKGRVTAAATTSRNVRQRNRVVALATAVSLGATALVGSAGTSSAATLDDAAITARADSTGVVYHGYKIQKKTFKHKVFKTRRGYVVATDVSFSPKNLKAHHVFGKDSKPAKQRVLRAVRKQKFTASYRWKTHKKNGQTRETTYNVTDFRVKTGKRSWVLHRPPAQVQREFKRTMRQNGKRRLATPHFMLAPDAAASLKPSRSMALATRGWLDDIESDADSIGDDISNAVGTLSSELGVPKTVGWVIAGVGAAVVVVGAVYLGVAAAAYWGADAIEVGAVDLQGDASAWLRDLYSGGDD